MTTTHAPGELVAVIMAGGAGTRFWPVSTEARPKQFLRLHGPRSLLQLSLDRVAGLVTAERVLVLTNERFVPLVRDQLPQLPEENIVGEPLRRDTSAAIALAALICRRRWGNPVMAVLTADHLIEPVAGFERALASAARAARANDGALYTFGIVPDQPATGYGYLQRGELLLEEEGVAHFRLRAFREKPDAATARAYLESGEFYWNSGMFVWSTEAILGQLRARLPGHLEHLERAVRGDGHLADAQARRAAFEPLPSISIDFGVMEHAPDVRCVAARFDWSDVGGWLALEPLLAHDHVGNALRHGTRLAVHDAAGNIFFGDEDGELVALVGVRDLIVVRAGSRTLVVHRDRAEEVKKLVASLEAGDR